MITIGLLFLPGFLSSFLVKPVLNCLPVWARVCVLCVPFGFGIHFINRNNETGPGNGGFYALFGGLSFTSGVGLIAGLFSIKLYQSLTQ